MFGERTHLGRFPSLRIKQKCFFLFANSLESKWMGDREHGTKETENTSVLYLDNWLARGL